MSPLHNTVISILVIGFGKKLIPFSNFSNLESKSIQSLFHKHPKTLNIFMKNWLKMTILGFITRSTRKIH